MSEPAWDEHVKPERLEEMYETFRARRAPGPEATDKEVAIRLARFAEARIINAARTRIIELEAQVKKPTREELEAAYLKAYHALVEHDRLTRLAPAGVEA